ncbi:hypothetical protein OBBRIDRAFT_806464 [Obba rivulosa]|uniref:Uncharacterized protein n=1 Tax=Obba rivulosa TaxID=1052685 RepID=A0A8E2AUE3_9APHY|nr:hypothetical protein OBBRIDRAFT_806464 [Obba rivulosa]
MLTKSMMCKNCVGTTAPEWSEFGCTQTAKSASAAKSTKGQSRAGEADNSSSGPRSQTEALLTEACQLMTASAADNHRNLSLQGRRPPQHAHKDAHRETNESATHNHTHGYSPILAAISKLPARPSPTRGHWDSERTPGLWAHRGEMEHSDLSPLMRGNALRHIVWSELRGFGTVVEEESNMVVLFHLVG